MTRRHDLLALLSLACVGLLLGIPSFGQAQKPPANEDMAQAAPPPKSPATLGPAYSPDLVTQLVAAARGSGDVRRGAMVFRSPQFACVSCHKVGKAGGVIGPDLTRVGVCLTPELIVEAVLWPQRQVKEEYKAHSVLTADGKVHQGYRERETATELVLRDPATRALTHLAKRDIEERRRAPRPGAVLDGAGAHRRPGRVGRPARPRRRALAAGARAARTQRLAQLAAPR
jgi:putative heme-binding domain-containing protein